MEKQGKNEVPVWLKRNLDIEEASAYFNIGTGKLRQMSDKEDCPFVLWNGTKRLIKREVLESYLENRFSI